MLEIKGLKKKYDRFSLDCTMSVKKGQITGLVGKNGAGKSTTFKAILNLIPYDEGVITIDGKDAKAFQAKDKETIGAVLSDSGFSGYLTLNSIIPILKNLYSSFDADFFTEQAARFSLPSNKRIKEFSTGMRAKLQLLTALSHHAKLLILLILTALVSIRISLSIMKKKAL